ncbi:hypothetical protein IPG41_00160 [Candidatus Peregrinibacteria bacterium]|nr:MAG: hypothetical protein IPG41_00160 [Candidatus Peregrinibacteria bacterium]
MATIEDLLSEIDQLKARNKKVEADKAWETSWTRKVLVLILTYTVMVLVFWTTGIGNIFVNAIVPSVGFFLSTLTIPAVKKVWLKRNV